MTGTRAAILDDRLIMMIFSLFIIFNIFCFQFVFSDIYMHNPRGSNNRNRESSVNTDNQNRLFDSQNNAKGGYCWGPEMYFYEGMLLQYFRLETRSLD